FGDTWNGNTVTVTVNGVSTDYTCSNNFTTIFNLTIPNGATVTVTFNANGGFVNECQYTLVDGNGVTIVTQGPNLPGVVVDNFVAACVPDFVYDWTPPGSVTNPAIADPILNVSGQETLIFTTYPLGHPLCATSDTIVVNVSATPYPGMDSTIQICSSAAPFDLFPFLGVGASPNGTWIDANGSTVAMPYDPGTMPVGVYTHYVDSNGCVDQANITILEIITDITNTAVTDVLCNGGADGNIVVVGNNISEYTVNGGAVIQAVSPFVISNLIAGNYTIVVYSNDGCSATEIVVVGEPVLLTLSVLGTDASCFGVCDGTVQITPAGGTGPFTYTWPATGLVGDQNGAGSLICAGLYDVTVTDMNLCVAQVQFPVTEPADVSPSILGDVLNGCFPHTVVFTNTTQSNNILTTEVDFGDGSTEIFNGVIDFDHTYDTPGLFDVTVTIITNSGCEYILDYISLVEVFANPNPNFVVSPDFVSMLEPQVGFINQSSSDVVSWSWDMPNATPASSTSENVTQVVYPFDAPGQYPVTLIVTNDNGCIDSITKYVTIVNDVLLFAPNAFTPDGDEFNQTWQIHISGIDIHDFDLLLFNRWGQLIWESHDSSVGWDGTYNGKIVPDGTYNWQLRCADSVNDDKYTFEGHVTIIK
ncbi:MAG: gliding motility-associated C-terminal domain-containing protein, partial [Crocinitomicaceae bacterium]|nr:gliding motility-associated C-terminal domain-containing protein [Crocinitomicaceae bacterium]